MEVALDGERVLSIFGWRHSYDNTENKKNQPIRNNVGTKMPKQSPGCKRTSHLSTECLDRKMCYMTRRMAEWEQVGRTGRWSSGLYVLMEEEGYH